MTSFGVEIGGEAAGSSEAEGGRESKGGPQHAVQELEPNALDLDAARVLTPSVPRDLCQSRTAN